jgi:hypothetical protein
MDELMDYYLELVANENLLEFGNDGVIADEDKGLVTDILNKLMN